MKVALMFYAFTEQRKTFLNRDVGFYAFTHLHKAALVCVRMCVCVHVCVREPRKCVNA